MKPSRLAASLREIADKIDRSRAPSRAAVSTAVRAVLAAMEPSIADFDFEDTGQDETKVWAKVEGTLQDGTHFWGLLSVLLDEEGQPGGWDWKADPGSPDFQNPETVQGMLDSLGDHFGI